MTNLIAQFSLFDFCLCFFLYFQGSKVTIMGQNGAGKSSIIKLLNGSLQVWSFYLFLSLQSFENFSSVYMLIKLLNLHFWSSLILNLHLSAFSREDSLIFVRVKFRSISYISIFYLFLPINTKFTISSYLLPIYLYINIFITLFTSVFIHFIYLFIYL